MRAAGFVLTGGNSTRMGQDKALLSFDDTSLVHQVAATMSCVSAPVKLVGMPHRYLHLPWSCLPDLRPGCGPLAGLETALSNTQAEWNLVVACDMPGLGVEWLRTLVERAFGSPALCVATQELEGRIHPLCALYRRACLPVITKALDESRLRLVSLLRELDTEYVPAPMALYNLNTPADWEHFRFISESVN